MNRKIALRCMPFISVTALIGCGDDQVTTLLKSFSSSSPFQVNMDKGGGVQIGKDAPAPAPKKSAGSFADQLGLKGDLALCAPESMLSVDQRAKAADLRRRLDDIVSRLQSGGHTLFAGEKNTLKETPNCASFEDEIQKIGEIVFPKTVAEPPVVIPGSTISIAAVDFNDEGHGWLVLRAKLTNGNTATFHLGVKTENARALLSSNDYVVGTELTKQSVGLRFHLVNQNSNTDTINGKESCTEIRYRNVCVFNPELKREDCHQESYTLYGTRSVETTFFTQDYDFTVDFVSADLTTSKASAALTTTITRRTTNNGTCYIDYNRNPFPFPGSGSGGGFPLPPSPR